MLLPLLHSARERHASDIILCTGEVPALKIMGSVSSLSDQNVLTETQVISYLKELASDDALVNHFVQCRDADFAAQIQGLGRYRVNAFFSHTGPCFVLRPIREQIPSFEDLGVPMTQFSALSSFPNGLVLFTGPMGSGKSSSMASVINRINLTSPRHIMTIEDPIEYIYDNGQSVIEQREIPAHSETFQSALRGALRQAVDVLLVGEMRDLETMSLALTAAETGSLVFATLHTSGAAGAIDRIINSYPKDYQEQVRTQLSQVLRAVVWQVLLPRADGKGRIPACEVLFNTHGVAHLIRKGETHHIASQMEISRNMGMMTMGYAVEQLLAEGVITQETAQPYLNTEDEYR